MMCLLLPIQILINTTNELNNWFANLLAHYWPAHNSWSTQVDNTTCRMFGSRPSTGSVGIRQPTSLFVWTSVWQTRIEIIECKQSLDLYVTIDNANHWLWTRLIEMDNTIMSVEPGHNAFHARTIIKLSPIKVQLSSSQTSPCHDSILFNHSILEVIICSLKHWII